MYHMSQNGYTKDNKNIAYGEKWLQDSGLSQADFVVLVISQTYLKNFTLLKT